MKFGLAFASNIAIDGPGALALCRRAQAAGFESLWGGEHVVVPSAISSTYPYTADGRMPVPAEVPIPDPLVWLAFAAAAAPGMRLGTCILILPQRNPVILAKALATIDQLSAGGLELGIGVGWMREEFEALGVGWERRGARTDEYVSAMRALWSAPEAEFHGEFVDFPPVVCSPRPVQPTIPIVVGGDTDAAIRRAARLADGFLPGESDPARLGTLIRRLREASEQVGRDPAGIEINAMFGSNMGNPHERVEELAALGVGRVMVSAFGFSGPDGLDRLDHFGQTVIAPLNRV
ncbi:MAG TPA: LLM class F420-dependent oxidoreductase [Acidimicrobiales bacterium]|nr:LLM class F420-dependent oxidoreductase [Acidimicrobiales bacterium]